MKQLRSFKISLSDFDCSLEQKAAKEESIGDLARVTLKCVPLFYSTTSYYNE